MILQEDLRTVTDNRGDKVMKFQNVPLFLQHLKKNALPHVILLIVEDPFEKKHLTDQIFPNKGSLAFSRFNATEYTVGNVIEALDSPFLMGGNPQVVFEEIEQLSKSAVDLLSAFLSQDYVGTLLLTAANKKNLIALGNEVDKRGVVLDLFGEKVWEKERRLSDYIKATCLQHHKRMDEMAIRMLIERSKKDLAYLANEVEKIITFVGMREIITVADVNSIGSYFPQDTVWKIAENMVWERKSLFSLMGEDQIDSTFFHSLVVALRYQYQFGYKLASVQEDRISNPSTHFASVSPWILTKRLPEARKLGRDYFHKALKEIFSIDLLSKNQVQDYLSLLVLFEAKMQTTGQIL